MTVHNWNRCSTASVSGGQAGADAHGPGRIASSRTRAIATRAVASCSDGGRSRTPSRSAATSVRSMPADQVGR